jgi:lipoprotein-anchoring transpeptidase ErfK/SrfK
MSGVLQFRSFRFPGGMRHILTSVLAIGGAALLTQCASMGGGNGTAANVVVSVKEQKLAIYDDQGYLERKFPVSTSKYGLSDKVGKYGTPTGMLEVVAKIGHGAPAGEVFKNRHPTGEVIQPDAPGRDPIVSRIMWLRGLEPQNKNAYSRCIYIHGTAEERTIGRPASYGCIRMKSRDVIELFNELPIGSRVLITDAGLPKEVTPMAVPSSPIPASQRPPLMLNPEPTGRLPQEPELPVVVAQNNAPAPIRTVTEASNSGYQSRVTADGSTYVSGYGGSPGVVLHSKRSASN